jgi:ERO1-like protein beta
MRSAASVFYLAVFALLRPSHGEGQATTKSRSKPPDACAVRSGSISTPVCSANSVNFQIDPSATVSDACISYSALDKLNADLSPYLEDVTQNTDFFAYYRLNLYNKVCPFWSDESSMCGNRACAVDTLENEEDIPLIWRAEELSKLEGPKANHPGRQQQKERPKARPLQGMLGAHVDESCVLEDDDECDERDYCVPEDEGATAKGDYVSLVNNTERFTGYSGPGARQVWDAIYKENCFSNRERSGSKKSGSSSSRALEAVQDFRNVMQEYGRQHVNDEDDLYPLNDECLEQRAFYRIISGMHASISTHICWDYFNQTTGEWVRNLQCYKERLHDHPERISNLYFNYALVTRAVAKLRKHFEHYTFCSGDLDQDFETKQKVLALTDRVVSAPHTFDETAMFQDPDMFDLKDDFKHRFRNVSRLMDCVGCDKCRLWGKLQTAGYGAALKVLFEFDENKNGENPHLRRTELVALVNTLDRISHSLAAIAKFRTALTTGDGRGLGIKGPFSDQAKEEEVTAPKSDFEDFEGLDDDTDALLESSLSEAVWNELDLVWRTYLFVLSSWLSMPFKLYVLSYDKYLIVC